MVTLHIYDKLLRFALFQGMSKADLAQLVAHTKLGFHKYAEGEVIAKAQTVCDRLFFLVDGRVGLTTKSADDTYRIEEEALAPMLFEPSSLFGISPHFVTTYQALTPCSVIVLAKSEIYKLMTTFEIVRINYINLLSAQIQHRHNQLWMASKPELTAHIIDFVAMRCQTMTGAKRMTITMLHLATLMGCSRLEVSRALNALQSQQLITLRRGGFDIPVFETLIEVKQ